MKGKGPELLLAMDDTKGDFLDRNDQHSRNVEYIGEIMRIESNVIFKDLVKQWDSENFGRLNEYNTFEASAPETIRPFIEHVTIPEGASGLASGVFRDMASLKEVHLPDGIGEISESAFRNCASLTSVNIPKSATLIEPDAFRNCTSLTSIMIPGSVREIQDDAFDRSGLQEITIENGLETVGTYCFFGCKNLESISLPESVQYVEHGAFQECSNLKRVSFFGDGPEDGPERIHARAFSGCTSLEEISLPGAMGFVGADVEASTFKGCTSLRRVTIPEGVKGIESSAFRECTSLTEITIPKSVV